MFIWKRDFLFWCSFSAFNKNFPQCPALIRVKWFLLILPRSLFTPTVLRNCFRIFVLSAFYLFVYISSTSVLIWHFLISHLGVRIPVPDKWVCLRSSLYTIWQNITMSNYFSEFTLFCFALYNFIIPLCSCRFLIYYVSNLISWKIFVNDFNSVVKIPLSYIFIFVNKLHFPHNVYLIYDSVFRIYDLHSYSVSFKNTLSSSYFLFFPSSSFFLSSVFLISHLSFFLSPICTISSIWSAIS